MSEPEQKIDYKGFRGAGGPSDPPPQKSNTNPTKHRIILMVISLLAMPIPVLIYLYPFLLSGTLIFHIISALCGGITIAIYDWIIEAYAYKKGLWFCYGGYQKIGKLDFQHVPIDMLIGFVGLGSIICYLSHVIEVGRTLGIDPLPPLTPLADIVSILNIVVMVSIIGALDDFRSKRLGIWMNGPTWNFWKCVLYAWVPLITSGIVVDRIVYYALLVAL